jgi:hypothetical protein
MGKGILLFFVFLTVELLMTIVTLVRGKGSVLGITLTAAAVTFIVLAMMKAA